MSELNINDPLIPDLSLAGQRPRMAITGLMAMVRRLEPDGQYIGEKFWRNPQTGDVIAISGRETLVSAEDLMDMFRVVIREEQARLLHQLMALMGKGVPE